jgi:hypothetical protein
MVADAAHWRVLQIDSETRYLFLNAVEKTLTLLCGQENQTNSFTGSISNQMVARVDKIKFCT